MRISIQLYLQLSTVQKHETFIILAVTCVSTKCRLSGYRLRGMSVHWMSAKWNRLGDSRLSESRLSGMTPIRIAILERIAIWTRVNVIQIFLLGLY